VSTHDPPLRVLLLAFEFPPVANGGVYRMVGLAETLPAEGVELDVVTVREGDYRAWTTGRVDDLLAARVSAERVCRTPSGFPNWYWRLTASKLGFRIAQYLYLGDPVALFWRAPLMAAVERIVRHRGPQVVLATAPPFGVAVLARAVARRYRLPWVVDWRDPWSLWCAAPFPSYAHYRYARFHEHRALREANASVATSHVTREDWIRTAARVDRDRLVTVYNGFDRHALSSSGAREPSPGPRPRGPEASLRRIRSSSRVASLAAAMALLLAEA
jgi:glycosyltransferase involved in cell wall biosynthesis